MLDCMLILKLNFTINSSSSYSILLRKHNLVNNMDHTIARDNVNINNLRHSHVRIPGPCDKNFIISTHNLTFISIHHRNGCTTDNIKAEHFSFNNVEEKDVL